MPTATPTRHTLRHLRRICDFEPLATSAVKTRSSRSLSHSRPLQQFERSSSCRHAAPRAFSTTTIRSQDAAGDHSATTNTDNTTSTSTPSYPDITNYYTLFPRSVPRGPPPTGPFAIPLPSLKREFLQLQSQHHPDKSPSSTPSHTQSRALSSLLNTAYKTLSDPLLRARYLLQHTYGVDITHEDNATHRGVTDQATLMEVMEAQEALEEAETHEQIEVLKQENQARMAETEKILGQAFENEDLETAKTECVRLNYWRSLQQALHDWEPGKEVRLIH